MNDKDANNGTPEKRAEPRHPPTTYYSVQFSLKELAYIYQFKIWNESAHGLCILIHETSDVIDHLKVGDVIEMKYYVSEAVGTTQELRTEIRHITKQESGRFKGHYFVGLLILDA